MCASRQRKRPRRQLKRLYPDMEDSQPDEEAVLEKEAEAARQAQDAEDDELLAPLFARQDVPAGGRQPSGRALMLSRLLPGPCRLSPASRGGS